MRPTLLLANTDGLTFVVQMVKAITWPLAIVLVALVHRNPLRLLIPKMKSVEAPGGFKATFEQAQERIDAAVDIVSVSGSLPAVEGVRRVTEALSSPDPFAVSEADHLRLVADISPRAAILESWAHLEDKIIEVGRRVGASTEDMRSYNTVRLVESLVQEGKLPDVAATLVRELRTMRNAAVHANAEEVTIPMASRYLTTSIVLQRMLRPWMGEEPGERD